MLIWSGRQAGFFAQSSACPAVAHQSEGGSSALITDLLTLNTCHLSILGYCCEQKELNTEIGSKQPSFDNLVNILYSYSNQPGHPKNKPT
jgi:hypothetical protein